MLGLPLTVGVAILSSLCVSGACETYYDLDDVCTQGASNAAIPKISTTQITNISLGVAEESRRRTLHKRGCFVKCKYILMMMMTRFIKMTVVWWSVTSSQQQ